MTEEQKSILFSCLKSLEGKKNSGIKRIMLDYSGRFMYGKTCLGFVSDNYLKAGLSISNWLYKNHPEQAENIINNLLKKSINVDHLGHDMVVYFPEIKFVDTEKIFQKVKEARGEQEEQCNQNKKG